MNNAPKSPDPASSGARNVDAIVSKNKPVRVGRHLPKSWILGGGGVLLVAATLGFLTLGKPGANTTTSRLQTNTSGQVPRALDGVLGNADVANPTPIAVMVENITESRPQSGLNEASVVYEALSEGGITRFMAVYGPFTDVPEIGPVRSARPYYVDWAEEYKAVYAHVGGSPQALDLLGSYRGIALNEFFNNRYFWRDHSRAAPHNVYTSSTKMVFARRDRKAPETGDFTPWQFLAPLPPNFAVQRATPQYIHIAIPFSSFNYNVTWDYNPATNAYERSQANKPHVLKDGSRVTAMNIIVQYVTTSLIDPLRLSMETIGTGRATVFRDGTAIEGTWSKPKRGDHTQFLTTSGTPIPLEPGRIWVEVVPSDRTVTVSS